MLISGFTVMVAMAGMYLAGISKFASFATGTIMVVAVAVIGSLTVLPALLSKLGDRVEKGRVPLVGPHQEPGRRARVWRGCSTGCCAARWSRRSSRAACWSRWRCRRWACRRHSGGIDETALVS